MGLYETLFGAEEVKKVEPKYNFEEMEALMQKHLRTKRAIEVLYLGNFSCADIAELLNLPESTVRAKVGEIVVTAE